MEIMHMNKQLFVLNKYTILISLTDQHSDILFKISVKSVNYYILLYKQIIIVMKLIPFGGAWPLESASPGGG